MTSKVAQPTLNNFNGKVIQSPPGQSKVKVHLTEQGQSVSFNGPTTPSSAERAQQFDAAVAAMRGFKLSDASLNLKIVGDKVFDANTNELIKTIGPTDTPSITPSVRNSALKGSARIGSPSLSKLVPSHVVGSMTTFQPAAEVEQEPVVVPSESSTVARRIRKLEAALAGLVNEIQDLKGGEANG